MDYSPGYDKALPLASGECTATCSNYSLHSHRQFPDDICQTHRFGSFPSILHWKRRTSYNVGINRTLHDTAVLQNYSHFAADTAGIKGGQVLVIIEYRTRFRLLKPQQNTHKGRFAATGFSNYGYKFSRCDLHGYIIQQERHIWIITEAYMAKLYGSSAFCYCRLGLLHLGNGIQNDFYLLIHWNNHDGLHQGHGGCGKSSLECNECSHERQETTGGQHVHLACLKGIHEKCIHADCHKKRIDLIHCGEDNI